MIEDAETYMQKIKARRFVENNGQVLRTINILRVGYEKLTDVKYALSDISEHDFLDSINYLFLSEYIMLRKSRVKNLPTLQMFNMKSLKQSYLRKVLSYLRARLTITP